MAHALSLDVFSCVCVSERRKLESTECNPLLKMLPRSMHAVFSC